MRVPKRKSEEERNLKRYTGPVEMTQVAFDALEAEVANLESQLPAMADEVARTKEHGDLSENAAYQHAKYVLRSTQGRIRRAKDKMKRASIIQKHGSDTIQLGSIVTLEKDGKEFIFELLGPHESDPSKGRISHVSPLGKALIGKKSGETARLEMSDRVIDYKIVNIT